MRFDPSQFQQGQFNFDAVGSEDGYRNWLNELQEQKQAFEKRWGIILSRKVRVKLNDRDQPLEGILQILDTPADARNRKKLRLYLDGREFLHPEIESIVRID